MRLGLQLYSVREQLQKDFVGTLKQVKEMGYEAGELAGIYGLSAKEVKDAFAEAGLIPISAHVSYQDFVAEGFENLVKTYKEIGCEYIAIPYLPDEYRYGTDKYPKVVSDMKEIAKVCNKYGIVFMYHNHDFEFVKDENGEYVLDVLYKELGPELLQTEIDTCWANVGGVDPAEYLRKYTGRAPVVHLKDFVGGKTANMYKLIGIDSKEEKAEEQKFEYRPVGYGVQYIQEIVDAARDAKSKWLIVEQDEPSCGWSRMECAKRSVDYMKTVNYK